MKLTHRSEYGLLALIYLARQKPGEPVHGREIAAKQKIPKNFLNQILFMLKRTKIVRSIKGPNGGYMLAKPPKEISLAEIIRLLDGPLAPTTSASKNFYAPSPIEHEPKMLKVLKQLQVQVAKLLEAKTLKDLI
jgi:Rrf2 family protein